MFELTVIVKDHDSKLTKKSLVYETCTLSQDDPIISAYLDEAVKEFGKEPEDVQFKTKSTVIREAKNG